MVYITIINLPSTNECTKSVDYVFQNNVETFWTDKNKVVCITEAFVQI
jgi:hypothetical protein